MVLRVGRNSGILYWILVQSSLVFGLGQETKPFVAFVIPSSIAEKQIASL